MTLKTKLTAQDLLDNPDIWEFFDNTFHCTQPIDTPCSNCPFFSSNSCLLLPSPHNDLTIKQLQQSHPELFI